MVYRPESATPAIPLRASALNLKPSPQLSVQPGLGCQFDDGAADDGAMVSKLWWHAFNKNRPSVTAVVLSLSLPVPTTPSKK